MRSADLFVFRAINNWPVSVEGFIRFFSEAMNFGWVKALLGLLVVWLIWQGGPGRVAAFSALLGFLIANGVTDLFKTLLPEHRPFQELAAVHLRAGWSPSFGTASAHSANMAAVAFAFTAHLRRWGAFWIPVALLTGISRVYVGVHYPHQVLLGWACGIAAGALVFAGHNLIAKRSKSDHENEASTPLA